MYMNLYRGANPVRYEGTIRGTKRQLLGYLIDNCGADTWANAVEEVWQANEISAHIFRSKADAQASLAARNRAYCRFWEMGIIKL